MAGANVIKIEGDNWQSEVVDSKVPVLVDFWAEWCGPCRAVGPIVDELADEWAGKLKVVKVNVDDNQQLAGSYNIRSIPTMLIIVEGKVKAQMVGALNKKALQEKVSPYL